jgi:hypothetical protein
MARGDAHGRWACGGGWWLVAGGACTFRIVGAAANRTVVGRPFLEIPPGTPLPSPRRVACVALPAFAWFPAHSHPPISHPTVCVCVWSTTPYSGELVRAEQRAQRNQQPVLHRLRAG